MEIPRCNYITCYVSKYIEIVLLRYTGKALYYNEQFPSRQKVYSFCHFLSLKWPRKTKFCHYFYRIRKLNGHLQVIHFRSLLWTWSAASMNSLMSKLLLSSMVKTNMRNVTVDVPTV